MLRDFRSSNFRKLLIRYSTKEFGYKYVSGEVGDQFGKQGFPPLFNAVEIVIAIAMTPVVI